MVAALAHYREKAERYEATYKPLKAKVHELEEAMKQYRQKCATLQNELDTSTSVQKDFVQLSQSLQIQLEKIRQAEHEVRMGPNEQAPSFHVLHYASVALGAVAVRRGRDKV